jgi:sigma-B regulation protein RsbU (phosphoserine phosphatase)
VRAQTECGHEQDSRAFFEAKSLEKQARKRYKWFMAFVSLLRDLAEPVPYPLLGREFVLGRQADVDLQLSAREVSRRHARIVADGDVFYLEDLGSSNGTYLNHERVEGRAELRGRDQIQIGPFTLQFNDGEAEENLAPPVRITATEVVEVSNANLFRLDAPRKLQVVLEIAEHLAYSLDPDELLPKLLDQLLQLFMQADRGMVVTFDADQEPRVRAVRGRDGLATATPPRFSRAVVQKVMAEGMGLVAEDTRSDNRFDATKSLNHLGIRSFVCVPLRARAGRQPPGVVILDRFGLGNPFTQEDLNLLTAILLQASVVLENAALHLELIQKARLERDVALARQIQEGFLPTELPAAARARLDCFARVYPAGQVAGDYYDHFAINERQLAFAVADISGKGIPAALLMSGIRTLSRHLLMEQTETSPCLVLQEINDALAVDNPHSMFVTMVLGVADLESGEVLLAHAGHPSTIVCRADGIVEPVLHPPGRLLGVSKGDLALADTAVQLGVGDTLVLYTDGVIEARGVDRHVLFGMDGLSEALKALPAGEDVGVWGARLKNAIDEFGGHGPAADDITLLLLRRLKPARKLGAFDSDLQAVLQA